MIAADGRTNPAESFAEGLSAVEKDNIGIEGMTPAQIQALEAAVKRFVQGREAEVVAEVEETIRKETESVIAERDQRIAEVETELAVSRAKIKEVVSDEKSSILEKAKVFLRPGTEVEYTRLESTLISEFKGWGAGTEFRLENGQIWRVTEGKYWSPLEPAGKKVSIYPGALGSFFIEIEGVKPTPRVMNVRGR